MYLSAIDPKYPSEGLVFKDDEDGQVIAIVAGVSETIPRQPIVSKRTKVDILEDREAPNGRNLVDVETRGLVFDDYRVFVPSPKATKGGPPFPIRVTGETGGLFFDGTDVDKQALLELPPEDGSSYWVVTGRKLIG